MKKITILTREVSIGSCILRGLRNLIRFIRKILIKRVLDFDLLKYGGSHPAVTRSLINGFSKTKTFFNFNPLFSSAVGQIVIVLSDMDALRQAINWKQNSKIEKLIAGPNIIELPDESEKILASPEIDIWIVPSAMTIEIYERLNPALKGRVKSWYAGVDENFWLPGHLKNKKKVLIYQKNSPTPFFKKVEQKLKEHGFVTETVIYGRYSKKEYFKYLDESAFAIFLSIAETQGIALVEAWSMDVPTIVWDPEIEHYYIRGLKTTASPYLSEETGMRWKELREFETIITNLNDCLQKFSPRKWVLNNMTDAKSTQQLLEILNYN